MRILQPWRVLDIETPMLSRFDLLQVWAVHRSLYAYLQLKCATDRV
jgi:hypothetical protein